MDAADERVDHHVHHAPSELSRHERADGPVAYRPADIGSRQDGIAGEAQRTPHPNDAAAGRGPEPGGDPECVAVGESAEPPPGPDGGAAGPDRHERVCESHLAAQVHRLASPTEEPVRAEVDGASAEVLALQGAAQTGRRFEQCDRGRIGLLRRPTGQLPGRGQAADAAADDDHPPRRHVRAPRRRR